MEVGTKVLVLDNARGQLRLWKGKIGTVELCLTPYLIAFLDGKAFAFDYEVKEIPEELQNEPLEVIKLYCAL